MEIRPYQQDAIDKIAEAAKLHRRILCQAPTGSGKTIIGSAIVSHAVSNGKRVLFLAHRREIVWQTRKKLESYGLNAGVIMGDEPHDPTLPTQVASIATLHHRAIRRSRMALPEADLVVVDECHSATAKTWEGILKMYPQAFILGLSATPIRQTGKGLGHAFDIIVHGPSIKNLTDEKWLVPVRYFCPTTPDLKGLKIKNGDYSENELEERMDKVELIGDIIKNWTAICPQRKTLIFASGVKHSIHIAEQFRSIGIKAEHIDGDTPANVRDSVGRRFVDGDLQVISNVGVYCEGTDLPAASCLIFARPTKSLRLYLQVAGRVLRPAPDKADCILLDHSGVVFEHGLIDQEWDWKLDYGDNTVNSTMRLKRDKKKEITCRNCKCVYRGMLDCPECHTRPEIKGRPVETLEAYLQELTALESPKEKEYDRTTWIRGLLWYSRQKGYKDGWAAHKYKEKFGCWPKNGWMHETPIEPPLEIKAYIQHLQIKYAKRRDNKPKPYGQPYWNWKQDQRANAYIPEAE